jgi:hypothetical protein
LIHTVLISEIKKKNRGKTFFRLGLISFSQPRAPKHSTHIPHHGMSVRSSFFSFIARSKQRYLPGQDRVDLRTRSLRLLLSFKFSGPFARKGWLRAVFSHSALSPSEATLLLL